MSKQFNKAVKSLVPAMIVTGCLVAVAIILVAILMGISATEVKHEAERKQILNSARIPNGVTISGVDVSGLNYSEAVLKLQQTAEAKISDGINFTLTYGGKEYKVGADSFVITFNTEDLVMQSLGMVKDSGYLALKNYMAEVAKEGKNYDISYEIDSQYLKERSLDAIYDEIFVAPVDAQAKLKKNIKMSYSTAISNSPFEFIKDEEGLEMDTEKLIETIVGRIDAHDFSNVEIPVRTVKANITYDDIVKNTVMRAYFVTEFHSSSYNRSFNVNLAAERLNAKVVAPDEVFSMEGTIGRRVGDPWKLAPAVVSGGAAHQNQYGGGVCQVATTLYNAVIKSDLQIVYRRNHSTPSSYVDRGLDATINTDTIDFKWRNNTNHNIYVLSWTTSSKEVYCVVYGEKFPEKFDRIDFKSTFVKKIEPTQLEIVRTSKLKEGEWYRQKAITGLVYQSFAYYYKGSSLVETKEVAESEYKMHPERIYVWPGYKSGDYLDPQKEMGFNEDTESYYRKYVAPVNTPTPVPTEQPTTEPTEAPEQP